MKILSIPQPWASLVALGGVQAISMRYPIQYRGQVAIVGAQPDSRRLKSDQLAGFRGLDFADIYGSVLGVVEIIGCADVRDGCDLPNVRGPYAWTTTNPLVVYEQPCLMPAASRLLDLSEKDAQDILNKTIPLRTYEHNKNVRHFMERPAQE